MVAKNTKCSGARSIRFMHSIVQDVLKKLLVLFHLFSQKKPVNHTRLAVTENHLATLLAHFPVLNQLGKPKLPKLIASYRWSTLRHISRCELFSSVEKIMSKISIIIPFHGNVTAFEATLASALRHQPVGSDLIVIHSGNYADPYDLECEGVRFVESSSHWITALFGMVDELESGVINTLGAGVEVDEGWCDEAIVAFENQRIATATPLLISESDPDYLVAAGVTTSKTYRGKLVGRDLHVDEVSGLKNDLRRQVTGPTVSCGFYRQELLSKIHRAGWRLTESLWELELALLSEKLGFECQLLNETYVSLLDMGWFDSEFYFKDGSAAQELACKFDERASVWSASILDVLSGWGSFASIRHAIGRFTYRPNMVRADLNEPWQRLQELSEEPSQQPGSFRRAA